MAKENVTGIIGRALAIAALATGVAVAHSWIAPVSVATVEPEGPRGFPQDMIDDADDPAGASGGTDSDPETNPVVGGPAGDPAGDPIGDQPAPGDADRPWYYIDTAEALRLFETGEVAFVDARHEREFVEGHISGAYFLPAFEFDSDPGRVFLEFAFPDQLVVIYCGGGECDASQNTANRIAQAGYTNYRIYHDGYPAWVEAGGETAEGADLYGAISE